MGGALKQVDPMGCQLGTRIRAVSASLIFGRPVVGLAIVYCLARLINVLQFAWLARATERNLPAVLMDWDGQWLAQAAQAGWPGDFSLAEPIEQSTWAWPPLVPLMARALSSASGLGTGGALIVLAAAGGLIATWCIYFAARQSLSAAASFGIAVLWLSMPASPVLIMGYAEGVFAAFVFASLWALGRGRHLLAALLLIPAGLSKMQVVPFAIAVVFVAFMDWRRGRGSVLTVPRLLAVAGLSAASFLLWPMTVGLYLRDMGAYSSVQSAWQRSSVPFADTWAWLQWLVSNPNRLTLASFLMMALAVVAAVVVARRNEVPLGLRLVSIFIPAFFIVIGAGMSTVRFLLPDPGLPVFLQQRLTRPWKAAVLGLLLVMLQAAWIQYFVGGGPTSMPP